MIRVQNLTKTFNGQKALDNVSFEINVNETAVILGPSGSGKTTLLRLIAGILQPDSGDIKLESDKIGFVFQDHRLLPWQTAEANISLVLEATGLEQKHSKATAIEWLNRLGLKGFERYYPAQLSGGMAQRVSIARAMAVRPRVMLMDEPFSSLDRELADALIRDLTGVLAKYRTTTVYVTHDLIEALDIGQRIFKLEHGKLIELSIPERKTMLEQYLESRIKGK